MIRILLAVAVTAGGTAVLPAASPHVELVVPAGLQRGTEQVFTFHGDRIGDARELLCYSPGFEVREITPDPEGKKVTVRLFASAECPLGEHQFRLRTDGGISPLKTLQVSPYPVLEEAGEETNSFENPQLLPLNHTVEGEIEREDVDYYAVDLTKGQRASLEIEGMRLGQYILDPYIAVLDSRRFEIAVCDDCPLLAQDAFVSFIAPEDGRYVIEVRESSYNAEQKARYRLHAGTFPRPTGVVPAAVTENSENEFTFIGDPSGTFVSRLAVGAGGDRPFPVFAERDGLTAPSANYVHVSRFPSFGEAEPNNEGGQATATGAAAPLCVHGVLGEPGDQDWFRFTASKDQRFTIQAHARSLRSPADLVVDVFAAENGQRIEGSDDKDGSLDGSFVFTAPSDGEFLVQVRDHLGDGGPDFVYAVEAAPLEPALVVTIPQFDRNDTQQRQMVPVPQGGRYATLVNVERRNSRGDLRILGVDLPEGVSVGADVLADGIGQSPVVFEAAADAPLGGRLADLRAQLADDAAGALEGGFYQKLELPRAINNQKAWRLVENDRLPVAVTEPAPFSIDIDPPPVPLVQGGSLNLKVRATRTEGFNGRITLRMLWNPPGVGAQNTIDLPEGQSEIDYPLTAEGNAQTRTWKIAILGEADAGKGLVLASSALTDLTVEPPFLAVKIDMATVEKGKAVDLVCNLEQLRPFEGRAQVKLIGLPHKATTGDQEITRDDTQVVFPIVTDVESPVGKHKNLFCQILVPGAGAAVVHNSGYGGTLRIDDPPPPPTPAEQPAEGAGGDDKVAAQP